MAMETQGSAKQSEKKKWGSMTMRAVFLLLVVMLGLASTAYSARDLASFLRISQEEPKLAACGPKCKLCACALIYPPNPELCFCVKKVDPTEELHGEKSTEIVPLVQLEFTSFVPPPSRCGPQCKVCACVIVCVCVSKVDPTMELRGEKNTGIHPVMQRKFKSAVSTLQSCGPHCKACLCPLIYPLDPKLCFCADKVDPTEELRGEKSNESIPVMNAEMAKPEDRAIVLSE